MAVLTGGKVLAEELGIKIENVTIDDLGQAKRVVIDMESTTIISGGGNKSAIDGRANVIRKQISAATSDYDGEKLQERLAKLVGGVAVVRVGAPSEAEMKSRKEAFEDAISAPRPPPRKASCLEARSRFYGRSKPLAKRQPPARATSIPA